MSAPAYPDFVNYDTHPEWLAPGQLRREQEAKARRAIDDLTLAQQSDNLLRAKIEQFDATRKDASNQIMLQALRKYSDDGRGALRQAANAKDSTEKRRSIALASSHFAQGLRYADQLELQSDGRTAARQASLPASPVSPCIDEQSRAVQAFEQQLNDVVATAVAVAFVRAGANLSTEDQKTCRLAAFEDVRSVVKGGTPSVPQKCLEVASAGRVALAKYARSHVRLLNPGLEELLSNLH